MFEPITFKDEKSTPDFFKCIREISQQIPGKSLSIAIISCKKENTVRKPLTRRILFFSQEYIPNLELLYPLTKKYGFSFFIPKKNLCLDYCVGSKLFAYLDSDKSKIECIQCSTIQLPNLYNPDIHIMLDAIKKNMPFFCQSSWCAAADIFKKLPKKMNTQSRLTTFFGKIPPAPRAMPIPHIPDPSSSLFAAVSSIVPPMSLSAEESDVDSLHTSPGTPPDHRVILGSPDKTFKQRSPLPFAGKENYCTPKSPVNPGGNLMATLFVPESPLDEQGRPVVSSPKRRKLAFG